MMEKYGNSPMSYVNSKLKKRKQHNINYIIEKEYSLKKSLFDPRKNNINNFLENLEKRMAIYYNELCKSKNLNTKKFNSTSSSEL